MLGLSDGIFRKMFYWQIEELVAPGTAKKWSGVVGVMAVLFAY